MDTALDSIPYSELRAHLAETLERLEARDKPIYISRRGEPAGVLLSVAQYRRLSGDDVAFGDAMAAWRLRHAEALAADAETDGDADPFADVRDQQPTRPVTWPEDVPVAPPPPPPVAMKRRRMASSKKR